MTAIAPCFLSHQIGCKDNNLYKENGQYAHALTFWYGLLLRFRQQGVRSVMPHAELNLCINIINFVIQQRFTYADQSRYVFRQIETCAYQDLERGGGALMGWGGL